MAHDVFVSYASGDKPVADAVCSTLESHGVRCWIAPRIASLIQKALLAKLIEWRSLSHNRKVSHD